jgi:hypothetical protein
MGQGKPAYFTINGETRTLPAWSRAHGLDPNVVWARVNAGWAIEAALAIPKQSSTHKVYQEPKAPRIERVAVRRKRAIPRVAIRPEGNAKWQALGELGY